MLHLILGPSGTGKSNLLMNEIRRRAEAGQPSILLVPEQFTSSTEGRIYRELGDGLSAWVSSYSFSSLAEKLLDEYGGAAVRTVTDAARVVLVRRAVEALGPRVTYYGRHRRSPVFLQKCAETLNELKSAGLTGLQLERLSVGPGREKLAELAAIYAAYEALLQETAMDPGDRVELAAQKAAEHPEFFLGRAVFVDEFDTFDSAKQALLRAMLAVSDVTVTLCADGLTDYDGGMGLFSGAKQVAARLLRLAAQAGCRADVPRVLTEDLRHRNAPGLAALGRALTGEEGPAVWPGCISLLNIFRNLSSEVRCGEFHVPYLFIYILKLSKCKSLRQQVKCQLHVSPDILPQSEHRFCYDPCMVKCQSFTFLYIVTVRASST